MMIHAFMLMVVIGTGPHRQVQPDPMYFRDINDCIYYARKIPQKFGNFQSPVDPKDRVVAYCKPVKIKDGVHIYDH
jgi:hypothetical protein